MLDFTAPADENISLKESNKLSKYKDLELEVKKCGNLKQRQFQS